MKHLMRLEDRLAQLEGFLLFGLVLALVVVLFIQVLFRFFLNEPLDFTEELSRVLLIWAIFVGASLGIYRAEHFNVDILVATFPVPVRAALGYVVDLVTLATLIAVVWIGWDFTAAGAVQTFPVLDVSVAWQTVALPLGFAGMAIHTVMHIARRHHALRTGAALPEGGSLTT